MDTTTQRSTIRVAHLLHGCRTLGPGSRTVVWVRGCSRRCPGCVATPILDDGPSLNLTATELLDRVLATEDEGVTFSGGEPFEQSQAVAEAATALQTAGRSVMVYTGYVLAELLTEPHPAVAALLDATDILVDGPFQVANQGELLWRGSTNQKIHLLSSRYRGTAAPDGLPGVGVEVRVDVDGRLFWAGVPPSGFVSSLRRAAAERGVILSANGGVWS